MEIQKLLDSPVALPSIPRVIALVLSELNKNEPDLERVGSWLGKDPVMTARLLQVSNSARFHLDNPIGSVTEALTILGLLEVREMVICAAVASAFRQVGGVDMQQFWRYSLNTAKLTRQLCGTSGTVSPYTVGLVHALGELVMHRGLPPQDMAELDKRIGVFSPQRAQAEHALWGYSYAQVGAGFARAWKLPMGLVETLEYHDLPSALGSCDPLAGILHLAAWRCRAQESGFNEHELAETFPDTTALALKMDLETVLDHAPVEWVTRQEVSAFVG